MKALLIFRERNSEPVISKTLLDIDDALSTAKIMLKTHRTEFVELVPTNSRISWSVILKGKTLQLKGRLTKLPF